MNLTEASYGAPRDSADFSGDLSIAALDRTTIVQINTHVVIGTQSDSSIAVLLRLLMNQVDDTLRLPPFATGGRDCTPKVLKKRRNRGTGRN
jgi:hypothetical protein